MRVRLVVDGKTGLLVVKKKCRVCDWAIVVKATSPKAATRKALTKQAAKALRFHVQSAHLHPGRFGG